MRYTALLAGLLLGTSVPASAATVIQQDNEALFLGFNPFDVSLGTLNSVILDISLRRERAWVMSVASATPVNATVGWSIDGEWVLPASAATGGVETFVPLTGTGTVNVSLDRFADGRAFGFFGVQGTGAATLSLDPGAFTGSRIFFNGFDPGFLANVGDTDFDAAGSPTFVHLRNGCPGVGGGGPTFQAEDLCGRASYTLTYNFTPTAAAAVPEPGTWAMMLIGFAGVGTALRRSRKRLAAAAA